MIFYSLPFIIIGTTLCGDLFISALLSNFPLFFNTHYIFYQIISNYVFAFVYIVPTINFSRFSTSIDFIVIPSIWDKSHSPFFNLYSYFFLTIVAKVHVSCPQGTITTFVNRWLDVHGYRNYFYRLLRLSWSVWNIYTPIA